MTNELDELLRYATKLDFSLQSVINQYQNYQELDRVSGNDLAYDRTKEYIRITIMNGRG